MKNRPGMALLMTLSILLILSLALAKSFEDRALERRHLEATRSRFLLENLSRSVVRGLVQVMRQAGYWELVGSPQGIKRFPPGVIVPLSEESGISNLSIRSLDHLYNLRQIYKPASPQAKLLEQTLNRIYAGRTEQSFVPNPEEVMSAINDYQDPDPDPDQHFPYGAEQYPQAHPAFGVKNAQFDVLSEVKVLPSFVRLGLTQKELEQNFRVIGDLESHLEVNNATKEEISAFLDRYAGVGEPYPNIGRLKSELLEVLSRKDPTGLEPSFDHPFERRGSVFEQEMANRGLFDQLTVAEKGLFVGVPRLVEVRFTLHYGSLSRQVVSQMLLQFGGKGTGKLPSVTGVTLASLQVY